MSYKKPQIQAEARKIFDFDQQMGSDENEQPLYGFLMRKTRLSWIQRWCVCSDNCLYISKSPRDHLSVTKVYLPHYSIGQCREDEHKREWVFKIWSEGRKTIFLAAQNNQAREQWVQGLQKAAGVSSEQTQVVRKSTIKRFASSKLSALKDITLGRDRSSFKGKQAVLRSPSDSDIAKKSLAAALEAEFNTSPNKAKRSESSRRNEQKPCDTVLLSGTLKKTNKRQNWEKRHYVVIGPILREYVTGKDEWPQHSVYLPGSKITAIYDNNSDPQYVLKIEPLAKSLIVLAAKSRLELNVWEQELRAISRMKPDHTIIRDIESDYADVGQYVDLVSLDIDSEHEDSFSAQALQSKGRSRNTHSGSEDSNSKLALQEWPGSNIEHRRTYSDSFYSELRQTMHPHTRSTGYRDHQVSRRGHVINMPPPPSRPAPTLHPPQPITGREKQAISNPKGASLPAKMWVPPPNPTSRPPSDNTVGHFKYPSDSSAGHHLRHNGVIPPCQTESHYQVPTTDSVFRSSDSSSFRSTCSSSGAHLSTNPFRTSHSSSGTHTTSSSPSVRSTSSSNGPITNPFRSPYSSNPDSRSSSLRSSSRSSSHHPDSSIYLNSHSFSSNHTSSSSNHTSSASNHTSSASKHSSSSSSPPSSSSNHTSSASNRPSSSSKHPSSSSSSPFLRSTRPTAPHRHRGIFIYSESDSQILSDMDDLFEIEPLPQTTHPPSPTMDGVNYPSISHRSTSQRLEGSGNTRPNVFLCPLSGMEPGIPDKKSPFDRRANTPPGTRASDTLAKVRSVRR